MLSRSIPNLVSGVSQQPAALRSESQCEEQINAVASAAEGLLKRPPATHRAKLLATTPSNPFVHFIDRDATEQYTVIITSGSLKVFARADGAEKTVSFPDGTTYLNVTGAPRDSFVALTIADHTFIANKEKTVAMDAALTANRGFEALVSVKAGNYWSDYKIKLYGKTAVYYRTSTSDANTIRTDYIAGKLASFFNANLTNWAASTAYTAEVASPAGDNATNAAARIVKNGSNLYICKTGGTSAGSGGPTGTGTGIVDNTCVWDYLGPAPSGTWSATQEGSTIWIKTSAGDTFQISVTDSQNNRSLTVTTTTVDDFSDLPTVAPNGFVTKVLGAADKSEDDYYVKFVPNVAGSAFAVGTWEETVAPNIAYKLDPTTMPFKLVRNGDGTFTFSKITWGEREVGDTVSNETPSFVGAKIKDIVFHRSRLGLVTTDSVTLSRVDPNDAAAYYAFFRATVTQLLDNDPVDHLVVHEKVVNLHHARSIPGGDLVLFSDKTQFALSANGDVLTPKTSEVKPLTEYDCSGTAAPVSAGRSVFFPFTQDNYTGIREFQANINDASIKDAPEITGHVPRYILAPASQLEVSTTTNTLVVLNSTTKTKLYVYRYYWNDTTRLQAAWSRWEFSGDVLGAAFYGASLDIVVMYSDGVYQQSINLAPAAKDANSNFVTHLDRRITEASATVAYNAGTNRTKFTLPFTPTAISKILVVTRNSGLGETEGRVLSVVATGSNWVEVSGDHTATKVYLGETYRFEHEFSEVFVKEEKNNGSVPITEATLRLARWSVNYADTGLFYIEVTRDDGTVYTYPFTGRVIGSAENVLGVVALESGVARVPVRTRADRVTIKVISESFLPVKLLSAGWTGQFELRSSRA